MCMVLCGHGSCPQQSQESFEVGSDYGNLQQSGMIVVQFYRTRFQGVSIEGFRLCQLSGGEIATVILMMHIAQ